VAVIGGGPIGSYVAGRLADLGYGVVVLEQKERLGDPVCCTGLIGEECIRTFAIDESAVLRRVNGASFFPPSGEALRLWRPETEACILDRAAFNVSLAKRAQDKGAEYLLNSLVGDVEVGGEGVIIRVARPGERLNFGVRVVVIASGFGSPLVERLGFDRVEHFVLGAQAEVETTGIGEVEVYFGQGIAPGFFAWLVPTSPFAARVGLLSRQDPGLYLRKLTSFLVSQGKIASDEAEPSYGGVPLKPLERTYDERVLVVGTAAGQVKPTTGGGIYYGLLCAEIAANSLHRALEIDDLSTKSLANYEREWRRRLGRELKMGYQIRKFYERLNDRQIERLFSVVAANGMIDALLKDDLSFDWHGGGLLRLLGHQAISRAIGMVKIPFRLGGRV